MRGLLADINLGRQFHAVVSIWTSPAWDDIWQALGLRIENFRTLKLSRHASDSLIWRTCQAEGLVLVTGNRNHDGPESLEAVIRAENRPDSLPVFTVSDAGCILKNRDYAERVAEKLLEYLMRIDEIRGTGRLYIP